MWNYNAEDIKKEASGGGNFLEKSGAYVGTIEDFSIGKTSGGASQAIIKLDIDGAKTTVYHTFTDRSGRELDFKVRVLNHLLYLNKLKNYVSGALDGKEVGIFLKAKLSQCERYINFDLEGVFSPVHRKTATELSQKLEAATVKKFEEKYSKEEPLKRTEQQNTDNYSVPQPIGQDDDQFPF